MPVLDDGDAGASGETRDQARRQPVRDHGKRERHRVLGLQREQPLERRREGGSIVIPPPERRPLAPFRPQTELAAEHRPRRTAGDRRRLDRGAHGLAALRTKGQPARPVWRRMPR